MATKRFRFRISRVIPSFQSCRSKDPSMLPSNPVPSFLRFSPVKPDPIALHYPPFTQPHNTSNSKPHHSSLKRHVSSAITSMACGCRSKSTVLSLSETDRAESPPTPEFHWKEEEKFHVIHKVFNESPRQKIYNSSVSGDTSYEDDDVLPPRLPLTSENKKKRRPRKKKTTPLKIRVSTSSTDTELFSSTESFDDHDDVNDGETEMLVSFSRSHSADSFSGFYNPRLETIRESPFNRGGKSMRRKRKAPKKGKKQSVLKTIRTVEINSASGLSSPEIETPARLSLFLQRLIPCTVDGKVRESFAVVKKSQDPYEDFKRSMMEMILEKQMFEEKDLEELLQCFLTLNSRQHHGVIVEAFAEIWEALFYSRRSSSFRVSSSSS